MKQLVLGERLSGMRQVTELVMAEPEFECTSVWFQKQAEKKGENIPGREQSFV